MKSFITLCVIVLCAWPSYGLELKISGASSKETEVVKNTLAYRRLAALKTTEGALFWTRRLARDAKTNLQGLGYYHASIESTFSENKESVDISVHLGEATYVKQVIIDIPEAALAEIDFPLATNDQLDHSKYEQGKQKLHAWLLANGYLQAKLTTHTVEVDRTSRTANIYLSWETGPQFKFGEVKFENAKLKDAFMHRYIPFIAGDVFSEVQLQKFSDQLRSSGYFASVDIIPMLDESSDLLVPIQVRLQPLKRTIYELGVSLGTDQGVGLEADVKKRRANSRGHHWQVQTEQTSQRFLLGGRYTMPSAKNIDRINHIDLTFVDELTDTSERQTLKGTLSKQSRWGKWQRIDSVALLDETFTIAEITDSSSFLITSIDLSRTKAKDTINPVKGWHASGTLSGASNALGSATDFLRADIDYKHIGPIGIKNRWLVRSRLGALWVKNFEELPSSLRFFAGGDRSVRGYDYEELGPTDADNNVVGGRYIATGSLELDRLILPHWRVATFIDAGNAFGDGQESLEYSAGLGVRWLSPIGPVRLDFASALSEESKPWRMHFSIGPDL